MSNVKRYDLFVQTGVELEDAFLSDCENGDWVKFTDYEAKCADYERLRDAMEKIINLTTIQPNYAAKVADIAREAIAGVSK